MKENVSFSFGPIALMNKIDKKFNFFEIIFRGLGGKAKNLKESAKLFIYNKLAESVSINQILKLYSFELFNEIGFKDEISDRTLYRNLERIGNNYKFLMGNYQKFLKMNYLILKAKQRNTYRKYISLFEQQAKFGFVINGKIYLYTKTKSENEYQYIFFSPDLKRDQIRKRNNKFQRDLAKGDKILSKINKGKPIGEHISRMGNIILKGEVQTSLSEIVNPYITGLEGYFILESSVDSTPQKILCLYKHRDKAEKLIRDMKEGSDLRPIRHWNKTVVVGYLLIVFLTNCLVKLTHFLSKSPVVKNLKLLKKYLNNLTVTIIYPKNSVRYCVLSNYSEEIKEIFGEKPPNL